MANGQGSIDEIIGSKAIEGVDFAIARMEKLKEEFIASTSAVAAMQTALGNSKSIKELAASIKDITKATTEMTLAEAKAAVEMAKLEGIELRNAATKEKQSNAANRLSGAYAQLNEEHKKAVKTASDLGVQLGIQSKEFKEAADLANRYGDQLKQVDAKLGNARRNVGNYGQAVFSLSQVFRELPAFTYSATQGILAVSNNLPILIDNFQATAGKVRQVKDSLGNLIDDPKGGLNGASGAFKIFAKSIFSFGNIFTIALGLFTIYSKEIFSFIKGTDAATEGITDFKEALEKTSKSVGAEIGTLQKLYDIATDTTLAYTERKLAVDELQKLYPNYLKNIKDEAIMAGDAATAYREINEALVNKAIYQAYETQIADIAAKIPPLQKKLKDLKAEKDRLLDPKDLSNLKPESTYSSGVPIDVQRAANNPLLLLSKNILDTEKTINGFIIMMRNTYKEASIYAEGVTKLTINPEKDKKEIDRVKIDKEAYELQENALKEKFDKFEITEMDYYAQSAKLAEKHYKHREGLSKDEIKTESDFNASLMDKHKKYYDDILKMVADDEKKIQEEKDKAAKEELRKRKEHYQKMLDAMNKFMRQIREAQEKALKEKSENEDATLQAILSSWEMVDTASDLAFEKKMRRYDLEERRLNELFDNQMRFIEQTGLSDSKKEKMRQQLKAETEAKQKKIDADRLAAKRKEARTQKIIDVNQIIASTALAIMKVWAGAGTWYTKLAQSIGIGLVGSAQLARVVATPLPQYAKGRKGGKAEFAEVNELGAEVVRLQDGTSYVPNEGKRGITFLPQGAEVIPHHDLIKQAAYVQLASQGVITTDKMQAALIESYERNTAELIGLRQDLRNKKFRADVNTLSSYHQYKEGKIK